MPELIIERCPCYPVVVLIIMHQRKVHPLQGPLSDWSTQICTRPYLLIRRVVLPITGAHVEVSVFMRDSMPHGAFEDTVIDKGHSEYKRSRREG